MPNAAEYLNEAQKLYDEAKKTIQSSTHYTSNISKCSLFQTDQEKKLILAKTQLQKVLILLDQSKNEFSQDNLRLRSFCYMQIGEFYQHVVGSEYRDRRCEAYRNALELFKASLEGKAISVEDKRVINMMISMRLRSESDSEILHSLLVEQNELLASLPERSAKEYATLGKNYMLLAERANTMNEIRLAAKLALQALYHFRESGNSDLYAMHFMQIKKDFLPKLYDMKVHELYPFQHNPKTYDELAEAFKQLSVFDNRQTSPLRRFSIVSNSAPVAPPVEQTATPVPENRYGNN